MATCILDYLSQPNPIFDNTNSAKGTVASNANKDKAVVVVD